MAQERMVWREMPVRRSISRWLLPERSSVQMVDCKCGFKTFTPYPFDMAKGKDNALPEIPLTTAK